MRFLITTHSSAAAKHPGTASHSATVSFLAVFSPKVRATMQGMIKNRQSARRPEARVQTNLAENRRTRWICRANSKGNILELINYKGAIKHVSYHFVGIVQENKTYHDNRGLLATRHKGQNRDDTALCVCHCSKKGRHYPRCFQLYNYYKLPLCKYRFERLHNASQMAVT